MLMNSQVYGYEQGYLRLDNGKFQTTSSNLVDYTGCMIPQYLVRISGKPVLLAEQFAAYYGAGLIPKWTCFSNTFPICASNYVIVGVAGKSDISPSIFIVNNPCGNTVLAGGRTGFLVEAIPQEYLTYQWYFRNHPILGATTPGLVLTNCCRHDSGPYRCALSTGGAATFSAPASLQVLDPVTIKKQPTSKSVRGEQNAVFRVHATGSGPLRFQWFFNDAPILGATNSFHVIHNVQAYDCGKYSVTIANILTSTSSIPATLSLMP